MPIRPAVLVVLLALANPSYGQSHSDAGIKRMCQMMQNIYDEMGDQLPIQVDFATRLVGLSAIYLRGFCHVNINYLLLDDPFIDEIVELSQRDPDPMTRDEAITFLNRIEGRQMLQTEAEAQIRDGMAKLLTMPKIRLQVRYQTMGLVHPFSVEMESTGSILSPEKSKGPSY